jgi:hypothetical protein
MDVGVKNRLYMAKNREDRSIAEDTDQKVGKTS